MRDDSGDGAAWGSAVQAVSPLGPRELASLTEQSTHSRSVHDGTAGKTTAGRYGYEPFGSSLTRRSHHGSEML